MARYTLEFLAAAQYGYEETNQSMRELARDLGIGAYDKNLIAHPQG